MMQNSNSKKLDKIDSFTGEYEFLSNFYYSPIHEEPPNHAPIEYPTVEHYFQAMKTKDLKLREEIAHCKAAGSAKRLGRALHLREDWEEIKNGVMYSALKGKFEYPNLRQKLLATGDAILVEGNWWHDNYWGSCKCDKCGNHGRNMLGQLLMQVREEIK